MVDSRENIEGRILGLFHRYTNSLKKAGFTVAMIGALSATASFSIPIFIDVNHEMRNRVLFDPSMIECPGVSDFWKDTIEEQQTIIRERGEEAFGNRRVIEDCFSFVDYTNRYFKTFRDYAPLFMYGGGMMMGGAILYLFTEYRRKEMFELEEELSKFHDVE